MAQKRKNRFWLFTRNILLFLTAISFVWFLTHQLMTLNEKNKYSPIGELVEVDGKNMHVYTKGKGENTIVLLSGLGTAAPVLDFEPLINELAKQNNVVSIESFGYGWSDSTNKERTVKNIVEEIRSALKKAGIEGPYILMPHSISGIYSLYYANKYPDEIQSVVGIDFTLPQALAYFNESAPTMPNYMKYLAPTGIGRLVTMVNPDDFLPIAEKGTYTEENLKMTKAISAWKGYNENIVEEANQIGNNVQKTKNMTFPPTIPVLVFTTKEESQGRKSLETFYKEQLHDHHSSKVITLEGHHYLHWTRAKDMAKQFEEWKENIDKNN
ncbi:alpha/beta fold hydrolase [Gracilibacillus dipsosauri]|uniref:alpha/beta fold hydrolase n=1 Tax=Gracilibacillus dipsosauri TaxID=178340 RepID=UPI00240A2B5E